jgi:thiamine biosynthesis lipoprotein
MADDQPTSSRRDFLRGRAAIRSLLARTESISDAVAGSAPGVSTSAGGRRTDRAHSGGSAHAKLHASRRAMACEFAIQYHAADGLTAGTPVLAALDLVDELETQLTIYRETSEIIELNRNAYDHPVEVEPRLFSLLELCIWLYAETGGAFDPTSSPLSRLWGFLRREGRVPDEADIATALATVGGNKIALDVARRTIQFLEPEVELNFNAVGKGYALDRVAQWLAEQGVGDYLCHGGSSSILARGRDRGDRSGGWRIAIPHPHDLERSLGDVILRDEALGTSGSGTQFFEADGRRYGHLIDPRTGHPAVRVHTATVIATTGAEADALSTAFYVMGPGGASEYCAAHKDVAAVIVCPREGSADDIDVHAFNLDAKRWQPT